MGGPGTGRGNGDLHEIYSRAEYAERRVREFVTREVTENVTRNVRCPACRSWVAEDQMGEHVCRKEGE